ncbi:MAG: nicotinamide-nucleotide amidohydrolase family protein [Nocardioidaceae bacterium]|nr:nicotinamide-nucleotide amidohydrolase family protein [Nocardioidaceae bacterium]MCL2611635.1 nicotinamide-nucleotide amidohydrolase family protein [Nocardioidaceae bacterium]
MEPTPADLVAALGARGMTLATAESLTGGRLAAAVTEVPGSSQVYAGGVVTYASEAKMRVLDVPAEVVEEHGVVSAACAVAMAEGARRLLQTDLALSTTGVAGPDRQEGKPVGTVFVGVAVAEGSTAIPLELDGDRSSIQAQVVTAAVAAGVSAASGRVSRHTEDPGLG